MKKILFTLLSLLCCMTAAWAGEGDGTKEHPFTGEWDVHDLGSKIKEGSYIAYGCQIDWVYMIVTDSWLNEKLPVGDGDWSPSDVIGESPLPIYEQYCKDNPIENRKKQSFIVTEVNTSGGTILNISGHFSGFYSTPDADGFVRVATTEHLWKAIQADARAKVRLTADFALSDIDKDDELYCETFYGTIDGNGHTIKGDPVAPVRARTYMFYWSDGATFKNLTFKGIRVNSQSNPNQAIITAKAQNGCVFENITFENVHTFSDYDNAGSVAGWAQDCTFKDITVKNSDFTVDQDQSGCVVGHAINCTFTNIKVENCESTSAAQTSAFSYGKSGGVVGRSDDCTFNNIEVLGCFIKTVDKLAGGVAGYSTNSKYTNCTIDDQSCVAVDNVDLGRSNEGFAGGIVGLSETDEFYNCINSALVTSDGKYAGGIVGKTFISVIIDGCLNTGLIISMDIDDVIGGFYNKYKTKTGMTCVTKTYQGKEYVIRKYDGDNSGEFCFGGIAGVIENGNVTRCANFGSVLADASNYELTPKDCSGIVGAIYKGKISDCLSDFSGSDNANGICKANNNVTVNNCLNLSTHIDIIDVKDNWKGFSVSNNYSLATASDAKYTTKTTADKIKSGEICHLLGAAWQQNLGTDPYPTPTGNKGLYFDKELDSEFNPICLPFAVNSDEKVQCYKPQSAGYSEDQAIYYIKLAPVDGLLAGEPGFCRVLEPGSTYTFGKADGESYQFTPQEYAIPVESSASGDDPDMSWTMSGSLQGFIRFTDDTNYGILGRRIGSSEMIIPNAAYIKGPSYFKTFTDGNPYNGKPIYIVSSTSPYDVNFDDEVNVADVPAFINQGEDFTPFIYGTNAQNLTKLTNVILEK